MEELIGTELGQYQIEALIGTGGMASVFKAYQLSLDRYVAIKVLPPSFVAKNPVFVKRFQREARSIARLHHPNILPVYDFGIDRDYSYIVMRYVGGARTLHHLMSRSLSNERIIDLIGQVAGALSYAHKHGVIHRDVKPSNILLDDEWALLSDFGLAKVVETATQLTDAGKSIGTPAYMSPEQARGEKVDYRTDIYSLGVILYEMLTRNIPHDAPTPLSIMLKRTTQPPASPRTINPAIPESVEQVVLRSLAVNPENRYDSAADYIAALKQAVMDESYREPAVVELLDKRTNVIDSQPSTWPSSKKDSLRENLTNALRNPFWLAATGLGIIVILLLSLAGGAFSSMVPQASPSLMASNGGSAPAIADTPTLAPTLPPTLPPTSTPMPATDTPLPSPSPTLVPTDTPTLPTTTPIIVVVTATSTDDTPTPTSLPSPESPPITTTPVPSPSPGVPTGTLVLLNPLSLQEPSYGPTDFEWEWNGTLPPGFGFEIRVWRQGEPPAGVHDAVLDNSEGRIEQIGDNRYRLHVDIREAAGVRGRTGEYLWTVVLVQIVPNYADFGPQAEPARLRFEAGGGDGGSGGPGGGIL